MVNVRGRNKGYGCDLLTRLKAEVDMLAPRYQNAWTKNYSVKFCGHGKETFSVATYSRITSVSWLVSTLKAQ